MTVMSMTFILYSSKVEQWQIAKGVGSTPTAGILCVQSDCMRDDFVSISDLALWRCEFRSKFAAKFCVSQNQKRNFSNLKIIIRFVQSGKKDKCFEYPLVYKTDYMTI